MTWYSTFFGSYYFMTFFFAWLTASLLKAVFRALQNKTHFRISDGFRNGGMPSSHSATVMSITVAIVLTTGFTPLFFLALVMSLIVISDAFGVRKNIGQQGEALNKLLKGLQKDPIKVVYGHSFFQVVIGTLWGVGVALIFFVIYF